jgi:uncharacterized repeat protein (TIGR01451 family)
VLEVQQKVLGLTSSQPALLEIHVRNRGARAAEDVRVMASVPKGWAVLEVEPKSDLSSTGLRWSLGMLEAQGLRVLRVRFAPATGGAAPAELRSDVKVVYQASVVDSAIAVTKRPALTLRVTGPDATLVGETASLVIDVTNTGGEDAADVTLQALLPADLTHPGGNDLEIDVGTLQPGETRHVPLAVTPRQAGEFRNRIRALIGGAIAVEREAYLAIQCEKGDRTCARRDPVPTLVQECKLVVEANGPRLLYPEWTGTFELALRNDDARTVQQAAVAVKLPTGLEVVLLGDDGFYDHQSRTIRWLVSGLKPGELRTMVWSGVARAVGDQVGLIEVSAGPHGRKSLTWHTAVALGQAERSVAPASSAAAAPATLPTSTRPFGVHLQLRRASAAPAAPGELRQSSEEPTPR